MNYQPRRRLGLLRTLPKQCHLLHANPEPKDQSLSVDFLFLNQSDLFLTEDLSATLIPWGSTGPEQEPPLGALQEAPSPESPTPTLRRSPSFPRLGQQPLATRQPGSLRSLHLIEKHI